MNNILVKGVQNFLGKEIPIVEGGFSENQKVMLAKTIAEIHETEIKKVNELINNNLDEFDFGIDILDLSPVVIKDQSIKELLLSSGYTNRGITSTLNQNGNIYLLSEQGYHALVSLMRTEKAKEIRKKLRREYFTMREVINSNEQLKASLLLSIYNGGQDGILASKQLTELEIKEATKPLLDKINTIEPLADKYNIYLDVNGLTDITSFSKSLGIKGLGRNNMYKWLRNNGYLMKNNEPYQKYITQELFILKPNGEHKNKDGESIPDFKTYLTKKGVNYLLEKFIDNGIIKK